MAAVVAGRPFRSEYPTAARSGVNSSRTTQAKAKAKARRNPPKRKRTKGGLATGAPAPKRQRTHKARAGGSSSKNKSTLEAETAGVSLAIASVLRCIPPEAIVEDPAEGVRVGARVALAIAEVEPPCVDMQGDVPPDAHLPPGLSIVVVACAMPTAASAATPSAARAAFSTTVARVARASATNAVLMLRALRADCDAARRLRDASLAHPFQRRGFPQPGVARERPPHAFSAFPDITFEVPRGGPPTSAVACIAPLCARFLHPRAVAGVDKEALSRWVACFPGPLVARVSHAERGEPSLEREEAPMIELVFTDVEEGARRMFALLASVCTYTPTVRCRWSPREALTLAALAPPARAVRMADDVRAVNIAWFCAAHAALQGLGAATIVDAEASRAGPRDNPAATRTRAAPPPSAINAGDWAIEGMGDPLDAARGGHHTRLPAILHALFALQVEAPPPTAQAAAQAVMTALFSEALGGGAATPNPSPVRPAPREDRRHPLARDTQNAPTFSALLAFLLPAAAHEMTIPAIAALARIALAARDASVDSHPHRDHRASLFAVIDWALAIEPVPLDRGGGSATRWVAAPAGIAIIAYTLALDPTYGATHAAARLIVTGIRLAVAPIASSWWRAPVGRAATPAAVAAVASSKRRGSWIPIPTEKVEAARVAAATVATTQTPPEAFVAALAGSSRNSEVVRNTRVAALLAASEELPTDFMGRRSALATSRGLAKLTASAATLAVSAITAEEGPSEGSMPFSLVDNVIVPGVMWDGQRAAFPYGSMFAEIMPPPPSAAKAKAKAKANEAAPSGEDAPAFRSPNRFIPVPLPALGTLLAPTSPCL
mgnify:CR=1 FL=1